MSLTDEYVVPKHAHLINEAHDQDVDKAIYTVIRLAKQQHRLSPYSWVWLDPRQNLKEVVKRASDLLICNFVWPDQWDKWKRAYKLYEKFMEGRELDVFGPYEPCHIGFNGHYHERAPLWQREDVWQIYLDSVEFLLRRKSTGLEAADVVPV